MPTSHAMTTRGAAIQPSTYDPETRSASAILATEDAVYSTDSATGRAILEVWLMGGCESAEQVPLLDNHERDSVAKVVGSVASIRVDGDRLIGTLTVSGTEPKTATKIQEGHIRDVSSGIQPLEVVVIPSGQTRTVAGREFAAPAETDLRIVTRWRLREVSVCPIGADPRAKIRSLAKEREAMEMTPKMRTYLRGIGLDEAADDEAARAFYEALPEGARNRADEASKEDDETKRADGESDGGSDGENDKADDKDKERSDAAPVVTRRATETASKRSAGSRRTSNADAVALAERNRIKEINRLGEGLPAEVVRRAVDEGWTKEQAAMTFVESFRSRSPAVAPAIHSRSSDEVTAEVLGTALAIRTVGDNQLFKASTAYKPTEGGDFILRKEYDGKAAESRKDQLLSRASEYSHLSMADICREACRLDGKPLSIRTSVGEVFRAAVSGSSMAAIFTTNFNAQFMTGYVDYGDTTNDWTHSEDVVNFLTREVATMGKFGGLTKLARGQTAEDLNTSDWKESYKIARYAGKFILDEQDIINDRFGALEQESPKDMGLSAAQLRPGLVYSELLNNSNLDVDDTALFHANHSNLASGGSSALSATSLQTAIAAMGAQRINNRVLNLSPKYLIVPQALRWTADVLVNSPQRIIAADSGGTNNPLLGLLGIIVDDRIGASGVVDPRTGSVVAGSATKWYLACRPGDQGAKTVMVGYLAGTGRAPKIRSFVLDKGQWGLGWDVSMDIGVKALDYRALYYSAGA